jgi:hypothetical protein
MVMDDNGDLGSCLGYKPLQVAGKEIIPPYHSNHFDDARNRKA